MSNRNDDIKQLFAHLGLNQEDYQELRRKSGGTEAERATQAGGVRSKPTARPDAPLPAAPKSGSRFDARAQPKVFLPGLTADDSQPEQQAPLSANRARQEDAETVRLEPKLIAPQPPSPPQAPDVAEKSWPLLNAAAQASPAVAQVRRAMVVSPNGESPDAEPVSEPAKASLDEVDGLVAATTKGAWRSVAARSTPDAQLEPTQTQAVVPETMAPVVAPAQPVKPSSLQHVLGRIAKPQATMTDRQHLPQLRYAPRLPVVDDTPASSPGGADLDAVLGRLARAKR